MSGFGTVTVDTANPDPSWAVHAFCRVMEKARSLGFMPRTEHILAEHLLRGEASLLFYSSSGGITAICMDDDALSDDDAFEMIQFVSERRRLRLRQKREREATEAAPAMSAREGQDRNGLGAEW